jgi:hypothetical protein
MRSGSSKDSGNAEAPGRSEVRPRNRRPVWWWSQAMTMLNWRGSGAGQLTPLISPLWRCGAGVASVRPSRSVRDRLFFGLVSSITTAIARSSSCPETARRYVFTPFVYVPAVACHSPSRHVRTQLRSLGAGRAADAPCSPVRSCRQPGLFRLLHQAEVARSSAGFGNSSLQTEGACPFLIDSR